MAIEHTYQPQYVTELNEATQLSSTDYLLISQKLSTDSSYLSKKIPISTFSSNLLQDADIASQIDLDKLSAMVLKNWLSVTNNNSRIDELISCVIKMANCIQTNKSSISDLYELYKALEFVLDENIDDQTGSNRELAPSYRAVYDFGKSISSFIDSKVKNVGVVQNNNDSSAAPSYNAVYDYGQQLSNVLSTYANTRFNSIKHPVSNNAVSSNSNITLSAPTYQAVYDYGKQLSSLSKAYTDNSIKNITHPVSNNDVSSNSNITSSAPSYKSTYDYGQWVLNQSTTIASNNIKNDIIDYSTSSQTTVAPSYQAVYNYGRLISAVINSSKIRDVEVSSYRSTDIAPSYRAVQDYGKQLSSLSKAYTDNSIKNITHPVSNNAVSSSSTVTLSAPSYKAVYDYGKQLSSSTNNNIESALQTLLTSIYPVGSIYITTNDSLPARLTTGMTWEKVAAGKCLQSVSSGAGQILTQGLPNPFTSLKISKDSLNHTHDVIDPGHSHSYIYTSGSSGYDPDGSSEGKSHYNRTTGSSITGITIGTSTFTSDIDVTVTGKSSIYNGSSTVQPPAYTVVVWRRTK